MNDEYTQGIIRDDDVEMVAYEQKTPQQDQLADIKEEKDDIEKTFEEMVNDHSEGVMIEKFMELIDEVDLPVGSLRLPHGFHIKSANDDTGSEVTTLDTETYEDGSGSSICSCTIQQNQLSSLEQKTDSEVGMESETSSLTSHTMNEVDSKEVSEGDSIERQVDELEKNIYQEMKGMNLSEQGIKTGYSSRVSKEKQRDDDSKDTLSVTENIVSLSSSQGYHEFWNLIEDEVEMETMNTNNLHLPKSSSTRFNSQTYQSLNTAAINDLSQSTDVKNNGLPPQPSFVSQTPKPECVPITQCAQLDGVSNPDSSGKIKSPNDRSSNAPRSHPQHSNPLSGSSSVERQAGSVPHMAQQSQQQMLFLTCKTPQTETTSDTQSGTDSHTETISVTQPGQNSQTETISGTQPGQNSQTETISGTQPGQNSQTETISVTQPGQNSQRETISVKQSGTNSQVETMSVTQSGTNSQVETMSVTQSGTNSPIETIPNTQLDKNVQIKPVPFTQSGTNSHTETISVTQMGQNSQIETTPVTQSGKTSQAETISVTQLDKNSQTETIPITQPTEKIVKHTHYITNPQQETRQPMKGDRQPNWVHDHNRVTVRAQPDWVENHGRVIEDGAQDSNQELDDGWPAWTKNGDQLIKYYTRNGKAYKEIRFFKRKTHMPTVSKMTLLLNNIMHVHLNKSMTAYTFTIYTFLNSFFFHFIIHVI